jgi:nitroimidazol reductase NimA-like FMN-containing flavoprotein (pyridoxamine 5'-phosphate oxidase superfamily)
MRRVAGLYGERMTADPPPEPQEREPAASTADSTGPQHAANEMLDLSREDCLRLLECRSFGRLAVTMTNGRPVIRPVNYLFDERSQSVVFRTAHGSKFYALVHSTNAAFEIDGTDERSRTGWSVIISGVTEEVTRPMDVRHLDSLGLETWAPGPKAHWVRIRAWTVSGRRIVLAAGALPGCRA